MRLILASQSPRRRFLLGQLGLPFELAASAHDIDEERVMAEASGVDAGLQHLAELKGRALALQFPEALVLSADTEVILGAQALGKPADELAALRMLEELSGRQHHVATALSLQCRVQRLCLTRTEWTSVWFKPLSWNEIREYVQRVQPFDFAGGYAIQGEGSALVERIEGSYSNVVGLPLGLTARMLKEAGVDGVIEPAED